MGPRDQRGTAGQEVERVEVEVRGSVVPWGLELEQNTAVGTQVQPIVGERGSGTVAQQPLERVASIRVLGGDAQACVEVEPFLVRAQRVGGGRARGLLGIQLRGGRVRACGTLPSTPPPESGAASLRDPASDPRWGRIGE